MAHDNERAFMELAVIEAAKCNAEDDQPRPMVAAVVVRDGKVIATAFRGELGEGEHAEFTALERKLGRPGEHAAGATVYTTLEASEKVGAKEALFAVGRANEPHIDPPGDCLTDGLVLPLIHHAE